jgi:prolyl 4-hydroxylase
VFPSLGLTLYPVKGAAAFWYNLLEDGKGDVSTRHAACPVMLGSKWGMYFLTNVLQLF